MFGGQYVGVFKRSTHHPEAESEELTMLREVRMRSTVVKIPRLTDAQRLEVRRRVAAGETFEEAAAQAGCSVHSVARLMARTGGMSPRMKPRPQLRLSLAEREEISRGLLVGKSMRSIALLLGRSTSTVTREVASNGHRQRYRAWQAEKTAIRKTRRPKVAKLVRCRRLRAEVERLLTERWSPQQIAHRLRLDHPDDEEMRVSHETIYRSLFVDVRGALRKELTAYLRSGRSQRRSQRREFGGQLQDMVMISQRPAEADDRAVPGHWEGDLLIGKRNRSAIATLVERQSRYLLLVHLPNGRTAEEVRAALARQIALLPDHLKRSLTWDQGLEMAHHLAFSVDTGVQVYFCDPHSPWQRGSSENTNGLLRQYFPKGTDLSAFDAAYLTSVADQLNGRPRQTLGWLKPCEVLTGFVATID
jgi:IS30 family transposase